MSDKDITIDDILDWLYQATAMKRRDDGLRVACDAEWNSDMRSAIVARLQDYDTLRIELAHATERAKKLEDAYEQSQVQLAGCSTSAFGWNQNPAKQGDYGWSVPYQDVLELRQKYEKAEAELTALRCEAERARPLLGAVERAGLIYEPGSVDAHLNGWRFNHNHTDDILYAALAYREGKARS